MDGFEFNKIAGAVLGTALGVMGLGILADFIYEPIEAEEPGYVIAVAVPGEEGSEPGGGEPEIEPIGVRLQVASVDDGASVAKKCQACHNFEAGAAKKVGPPLWDIVERPIAAAADFGYSDTLRAAGDEGRTWTFEELDKFLAAPKAWMTGTTMAFAGLNKPGDRADMIAYLRSLSDDPVPLPAVVVVDDSADGDVPGEGEGTDEESGEPADAEEPAEEADAGSDEGEAAETADE